ncbi:MAG: T9SS type A sorting domain-containing protein [Candidatus Kapabacteria bacterium]|nr:T9SS type A sorting domain-containing protein [Candidatus Kapabacteria bacterium]
MFGQDSIPEVNPIKHECDCIEMQSNTPIIEFKRMLTPGGTINTYDFNGCFLLNIADYNLTYCSNIYKIELDFSDFPPCIRQHYSIQYQDMGSKEWNNLLSDVQLPDTKILLPLNAYPANPNKYHPYNYFKICPFGNVDCGLYKTFKIKYKIIMEHPDGKGGKWYENCDERETDVKYVDYAALDVFDENPNYLFTFSPLPVKNILNISCNTLKNFDVNILDLKGTLVYTYKHLNNNTIIDLSNLISGVYNIQILENDITVKVKKFTKE